MLNIEIKRPKMEDFKELNKFFRMVIRDTFNKEGIGDKLEDLAEEIETKKSLLGK